MNEPLRNLIAAVAAVAEGWPDVAVEGAAGSSLVALNDALGRVRRLTDGLHAQVAAEIARQSRPELGPDGLAKTQGYRNPTALIAATTGSTNGEAARLVQVGEATAPRLLLSGERAPARHPHVACAVDAGRIGAPAAAAIIGMLDRVVLRAGREATEAAERTLVEQAPGLSADQLAKLIARAEAWLDPDGVEPREDELRSQRYLHIREERNGMTSLSAMLDPEHAAPVRAALEALVSADLRAPRVAEAPGSEPSRPSIPKLQADALARLCAHALGCDHTDLPLEGATVVVRVTLDDLAQGTGSATIDGMTQPVSIGTVRRMAAGGSVIPCVLGGKSEILDWGRRKRLFTKAQKFALIERDGGCAACGAPPGMTRVHHIRWWLRDSGTTDLSNGVLLCDSCHHRVHDNGYEIRIDGTGVDADVWLIPPPWVDSTRTPRRGARKRFDFVPA
ncbi:DUF222 domain-containing protein [Microbacterium sp. Sa4CUA7]|uniref:DUF222 domain-containing protein n=1 Tax=Microbacterium pullorum TaxID=2762236 RepID=A0ABR8S514_9MICO|nr:DUF222 domain-containing protein [Microbacterium pullorum]MBD7958568.1 DUF222 domain-containing protein [Microbacterium pullorum]